MSESTERQPMRLKISIKEIEGSEVANQAAAQAKVSIEGSEGALVTSLAKVLVDKPELLYLFKKATMVADAASHTSNPSAAVDKIYESGQATARIMDLAHQMGGDDALLRMIARASASSLANELRDGE